jgi:hypothetical protein
MNAQQTNPDRPACPAELTEAQLEHVAGGVVTAEPAVVAPRDSVSGNATGRRAYKPY